VADGGVALRSARTRADNTQVAAVLRSIRRIKENIGASHSLRDLAHVALFSPYHFHRVFRQHTASTPAQFLAAVRMAEAKRLLAFTPLSVTDVCARVGYASLGTFTTQFTRLVGAPPRRFRRLFEAYRSHSFASVLSSIQLDAVGEGTAAGSGGQVTGLISGGLPGTVAVAGLFHSGIPQERPVACAIASVPGAVSFNGLADGDHYPLAMAFHPCMTVAEVLFDQRPDLCFVAASPKPVSVRGGVAREPFGLQMRTRRATDPPLVLALPLLIMADHQQV
jgi:AraC-like DNA-binding protein